MYVMIIDSVFHNVMSIDSIYHIFLFLEFFRGQTGCCGISLGPHPMLIYTNESQALP